MGTIGQHGEDNRHREPYPSNPPNAVSLATASSRGMAPWYQANENRASVSGVDLSPCCCWGEGDWGMSGDVLGGGAGWDGGG